MEDRRSTLGRTFEPSKFFVKGGLGYISLEDALELYKFDNLISQLTDEEIEIEEQRRDFLDSIDAIAEKYLNPKEKCIYYLSIHEKKKTSDITIILNYNGWRTTQNSIDRVFKILSLYHDFESIDKSDLEYEINRNFNKLEIKIIKHLEMRYTIKEISSKLGKKYHYTKTHCLIKNILNRLADSGGSCRQFYDFLIEIRKFKDSCNFDEKVDRIKVLEEVK